jgi:hypothetical protein
MLGSLAGPPDLFAERTQPCAAKVCALQPQFVGTHRLAYQFLKPQIGTASSASLRNAFNGRITSPFKNPAIALRDRKSLPTTFVPWSDTRCWIVSVEQLRVNLTGIIGGECYTTIEVLPQLIHNPGALGILVT